MEWRSFPDPSYKADYSNELLTARGWRWPVVVCTIIAAGAGVWLMIRVGQGEIRSGILLTIAYILVCKVVGKILDKVFPSEENPKVKCSGCFEEMEKVQGSGPTENAVFHVCHKCRKYVDTGLNAVN